MACPLLGADGGPSTPDAPTTAFKEAIAAIVEELLDRRDPLLDWEPERPIRGEIQQSGGRTALVLLALHECGISLQQPHLEESLTRLFQSDHDGTYTLALRIMLLARLPDRWRPLLEREVSRLLGGFSTRVDGWGYRPDPDGLRHDNSTTQFAALALRDAAERGIRVPDDLWARLRDRFLGCQLPDGAWDYAGEGHPRASMTAAAIATLAICADRLHRDEYLEGTSKRTTSLERSLRAGLDWLDLNFSPKGDPGHAGHHAYHLFAIERAAQATGLRAIGRHDWLLEGASELLRRGCVRDRSQGLRVRSSTTPSTPNLALTLLFLQHGLVPEVVADLVFTPERSRPHAVPSLVRELGLRTESRLGWIRVALEDPTSLTSLDRPLPAVLWLDLGRAPEAFTGDASDACSAVIQAVREGQVLVCSIDGSMGRLRRTADQFAGLLPGCEVRNLRRDDPERTGPWPVRTGPPVLTLTNGVRTLIYLVGGDPAGQLQSGGRQTARSLDLLANICSRAHVGGFQTDLGKRIRPTDTPIRRGRFAHVGPPGRAPPEPEALPVAARRALVERGHRWDTKTGTLGSLSVGGDTDGVFLSGIDAWTPREADWDVIESWLGAGTCLFIETTGGNGGFTTHLTNEVEKRFASAAEPVTGEDPLLSTSDRSGPDPARTGWTAASIRRIGLGPHGPRLREVPTRHPGRLLLADFDLTHAMLGRDAPDVHGWRTPWVDGLLDRIALIGVHEADAGLPASDTDPDDS